jgi:hypothetical protein
MSEFQQKRIRRRRRQQIKRQQAKKIGEKDPMHIPWWKDHPDQGKFDMVHQFQIRKGMKITKMHCIHPDVALATYWELDYLLDIDLTTIIY